jgi:hypothetical protein
MGTSKLTLNSLLITIKRVSIVVAMDFLILKLVAARFKEKI